MVWVRCRVWGDNDGGKQWVEWVSEMCKNHPWLEAITFSFLHWSEEVSVPFLDSFHCFFLVLFCSFILASPVTIRHAQRYYYYYCVQLEFFYQPLSLYFYSYSNIIFPFSWMHYYHFLLYFHLFFIFLYYSIFWYNFNHTIIKQIY